MTDLTDQDRRDARQWANDIIVQAETDERKLRYHAAARVILALVEAPAPTLAEELRAEAPGVPGYDLAALAACVEQIEQERDEAKKERDHFFREVENVRTWKEQLLNERDEARAEVERLRATHPNVANTRHGYEIRHTANGGHIAYAEMYGKPVQEGVESNAESLDPADVKPGEAWLVECRGERRNALKDNSFDTQWNTVNADGWPVVEHSEDITLVARLVPEPPADTTPHHQPK